MPQTKRSPTAAEAELQQRQADPEGDVQALKDDAREQRKQQSAQLSAGKGPRGLRSGSHVVKGNPAEQRTRRPGEKPIGGTVDNMTARDGADPLVGHMVTIDYSKKETRDFVQNQLAPEGSALAGQGFEVGTHSADYGALLDVGEVGDDGYPVTGKVFLRDEHAAIVNVPWSALRRSLAGGRR
jgi:hypothetical protein